MAFKLDNLFEELYPFIFQYLDLNDLNNLLVINKKLNNLVKQYPIKELIFDNGKRIKDNWILINKPINYKLSTK